MNHLNLENFSLYREAGKITKSLGLIYEAFLPGVGVGSLCRIEISATASAAAEKWAYAEVVGFKDRKAMLMPLGDVRGLNSGSRVFVERQNSYALVGPALLGRILDGAGEPIDSLGPLRVQSNLVSSFFSDTLEERSLYRTPSHPLERAVIRKPLDLGVRSINGLLTCGAGQRVGIMAGSGVGKSVLLGMMARHTAADVNVIALIGERGREVREFIERDLGPEGLKKSVVVVSTSDKSPLLRMRGAFLATTIAEYFRDQGKDVLLLMDSITRFSMAQREIGLSLGEPPASKGYTPSVFAVLPKLLERAGTSDRGSITGLYTVLADGDDMDDPIVDAARSILDGHIVLSRKIAQKNQFPAIDVLQSASRVMRSVTEPQHQEWVAKIREWMAVYAQAEDLINIGAYVRGSNPKIDQAIAVNDRINAFLRQGIEEKADWGQSLAMMHSIVRAAEAATQTTGSTAEKSARR